MSSIPFSPDRRANQASTQMAPIDFGDGQLDGIPVVRGPCGHEDIIDDDKMDYADANARKA